MGAVAETMREKISAAFSPSQLDIIDDSDRHGGHAGARPGGQSHFTLIVRSAAFAGVGRVARQRMVHSVLADELAGPVHALAIKALAPGEG